MIALTFCFSALLGLLVASLSDRSDTAGREGPIGKTPTAARTLALTVHPPIYINGNGGFTNASGVVWGSGTESDPYIIEGWDIHNSAGNVVEIRNTDAYFVIRQCYLHDSDAEGVNLLNCRNGTVMNNGISKNYIGVRLESSSFSVVSNNTFDTLTSYAVSNHLSNNNWISNNTCLKCRIYLDASEHNAVVGNNCTNGGIDLYEACRNVVCNNTCLSDGNHGVYLTGSDGNTICHNDLRNGYGISLSGLCDLNVIVENICITNLGYGMYLSYGNGNIINNNTFNSNRAGGLYITGSSATQICNNSFSNDSGVGIALEASSSSVLYGNSLLLEGIYVAGSIASWNTHSIDASNSVNGLPIRYYRNEVGITVPGGAGEVILANCTDCVVANQVLGNSTMGIGIGFSSGTLVLNNSCYGDFYHGIKLEGSSWSVIRNNSCWEDEVGIYDLGSNNNTLSRNHCWMSTYGIQEWTSRYNRLDNNTCSLYTSIGIDLFMSDHDTIENNSCGPGDGEGIWLSSSSSNRLSNNTCASNSWGGMGLSYSNDNILDDNTCTDNSIGVIIGDSNRNTICRNLIRTSQEYGVHIYSGNDNLIWNNTFVHNNGSGDAFDPSHVQAYDAGTRNGWNSADGYGNYWSDWTTPDADTNGVVDEPYLLDGGAGAKDNYPLTTTPSEPIPEFSTMPLVVMGLSVVIVLAAETRRKNALRP
jgi:parallel beta-helix repeat protein